MNSNPAKRGGKSQLPLPGYAGVTIKKFDISGLLRLGPGGKELLGKKHRPGWPSSRRLQPASAGCGGRNGRPDFVELPSGLSLRVEDSRAAGRPSNGISMSLGKNGSPARPMKWKLPHDFCAEGPCPRAWHEIEGHF
jgi:hypothetical protein